jgi:hypothetical protein
VLPGSFKKFVANVARVDIADRVSVPSDAFGKSHCIEYRFLENRMQKLHDKLYGSFIVVVKNYLKIAGVVVNVAH